ncbi:hypothetical protein BDV95DRAFT_583743 [Massariosphaeria phaeospora]|uniref:U1-C C2H2-type zinc finger domain-containing protein n=1 Tax=Massariosphaeria phaeospora TaxID=100035 RepID=A0A7C8HZX2_9PLEO|nr:hypothetical protein BDV95DRAFT_583743 [Massariosphaeria phaeospora]
MSEYWKSIPKYWCKFCLVYVKDTKFERAQHEATGRHQGSIQRSLKGLHREQEIEERKKQQAKNEVARLNGLVTSGSSSVANPVGSKPTITQEPAQKATIEDRKKQWSQLAAMGIAVPEQARSDFGQAGEWKVVSRRVVGEIDEGGEFKPAALNKGVLKRKLNEEEEEQIAAGEMITKRKGWGQTYKLLPGKAGGADDDIESLFNNAKSPGVKKEGEPEIKEESKMKIKQDPEVQEAGPPSTLHDIPTEEEASIVGTSGGGSASKDVQASSTDTSIKKEDTDNDPAPAVVFKKRKKIAR